ncbi:MAG: mannose-1-phosphate guanylyltransferase/mannose-6-phosphate isomerase [Rickettsiaceae bacterium]
MSKAKPIILAGGSGRRVWPLSTKSLPKQFIGIFNNTSILQATVIRNQFLGEPCIITTKQDILIAKRQLQNFKADLILEPEQKNTAPCILIGALQAKSEGYNTIVALPVDHYIKKQKKYISTINNAISLAHNYGICTIGIRPDSPNTEYGYIKAIKSSNHDTHYTLEKFIEKPNEKMANFYTKNTDYFWNSGIFVCDVDFIIKIFKEKCLDIYNLSCKALNQAKIKSNITYLDGNFYSSIPSTQFDQLLMESMQNLAMLHADFHWHDLGNFDSIWQASKKDQNQNYCSGNILTYDVKRSYINTGKTCTAVIGLYDIIVVNNNNNILIASKSKLKNYNTFIQNANTHYKYNDVVVRNWGWFNVINSKSLYKIKELTIHPGCRISLQYHNHRSEYWVVIKGYGEVELGNKKKCLSPNDFVFIPKGLKHRVANTGAIDLCLIEIQIGCYLSEDDIIRLS